jgi:hypothetical protein
MLHGDRVILRSKSLISELITGLIEKHSVKSPLGNLFCKIKITLFQFKRGAWNYEGRMIRSQIAQNGTFLK